jgi:hypothetical protein
MPGSFPEILSKDFNLSATSIQYRLERVAAVTGLRMLIADDRNYGVGQAYDMATMESVQANYPSLPRNLQNVMRIFNIADEPRYITPNQLPNEVSKIQQLVSGDLKWLSWANLYSNRVGPTMFFGPANDAV